MIGIVRVEIPAEKTRSNVPSLQSQPDPMRILST